jgi:hypothetical protein
MTCKTLLTLLPLALTLACKDAGTDSGADTSTGADADSGDPAQTDGDGDGFFAEVDDCDDADASVNPAAQEACDSRDNNCDGAIDEGVTQTYFADADGDTYGDKATATELCVAPTGFVTDNTDCDDGQAAVNPAAQEVCDSIDNDCDSLIDDDDDSLFANEGVLSYADADGDGYGDPTASALTCAVPEGFTEDNTDCDDADVGINPAADEVCDSVDNDCDSLVDTDDTSLTDGLTAYGDGDLDGFGDADDARVVCALSAGVVADDDDCDDDDDAVNPDAEEACQDKVDNNCDGGVDEGCPTCDDLEIVQYFDSFTVGSTPLDKAQALGGFTLSSSYTEAGFSTAYDSGTWDVVVIDVPGSSIPSGVEDRLEDAIASGTVVLFSYWDLGDFPTLATTLGVTTDSSFSTPLPLSAASGSTLWSISETLPSSISSYSNDAGTNGVVLSPIDAATSETLAIYSGDATKEAIVATFNGQVIVNGHLSWDFQSTDDDADGRADMAELYMNELSWAFGCTF